MRARKLSRCARVSTMIPALSTVQKVRSHSRITGRMSTLASTGMPSPQLLARDILGAPLVRRIDERPEESDGDRLDPFAAQRPGCLPDVLFLQRNDRRAGLIDPLADRPPKVAIEQRPRWRCAQVPAVGLVALPEPQNVTMAVGAEQACFRQAALDEDVGGRGRAVHEAVAIAEQRGEIGAELACQHLEALDHAIGRVLCGRHLGRLDGTPVGCDAVRVGSADVDGGDISHGWLLVWRPRLRGKANGRKGRARNPRRGRGRGR